MSKQDIKDETKSSDGDPEVKARIKRAMRAEVSMRRMMEEVPKADVVITNPTHFAVALSSTRRATWRPRRSSRRARTRSPSRSASSRGEQGPIMEDPPLARALFRSVRSATRSPERFYEAVATVLA